ncbi:Fc.00g111320.m01.CDS01 [Cosmosporella sp. VM-42]
MAPSKSRKRKSDQDFPTEAGVDAMTLSESKRQRNLPMRGKDEETAKDIAHISTPAQGNLKVFTDDDDTAVPEPALAPVSKPAAPADEEEDEDSDDEAPEAVSTSRVASDVKKSAQAAQKVAQEQAAAQKRKRQQRDALFKQQAEERKKLEDGAKAMANVLSRQDEDSESDSAQVEVTGRRRRTDKVQIPNLLPAEFLTDSSSEDEDEGSQVSAAVRPKRRKITTIERSLDREGRGPRDEMVGSTVYRVAKKVDDRIAPKLRKHAKSSRDLLLKRNRAAVKPRSGFFVQK